MDQAIFSRAFPRNTPNGELINVENGGCEKGPAFVPLATSDNSVL